MPRPVREIALGDCHQKDATSLQPSDMRLPIIRHLRPSVSSPPAWQHALLSSALAACLAMGGGPAAAPAIDMSTPLSALQSQERTVEDLFEKATPSVAFITTFVEKTDRLTMNAVEVPAGTGSGFVWDKEGHIVVRSRSGPEAYHISISRQASRS